jgi:ComF family protein
VKLRRVLADILFPPLCHACREFIPDSGRMHICSRCLERSGPVRSPLCTICGIPFFTEGGEDHPCGGCLADPPPFAAARGAVYFEGPVRELVHGFKYNRRIHHRKPLALLTAERLFPVVREWDPELVIPVPLHLRKVRERGFNQALLLGEVLSREWGLPLSRRNLQRIRWTEPQIGLRDAARQDNVKGAFCLSEPGEIRGRKILLVDDVLTTGSTVAECARVLGAAGAAAVHVATVARAVI